ncbi:MAG: hypothetical protein N4A33_10130 [Bacteriovoracaceae bacterium]|jgi:hypothetical protein|nr:hypothetical protein [Bacteriovoracaceae bacterium]
MRKNDPYRYSGFYACNVKDSVMSLRNMIELNSNFNHDLVYSSDNVFIYKVDLGDKNKSNLKVVIMCSSERESYIEVSKLPFGSVLVDNLSYDFVRRTFLSVI